MMKYKIFVLILMAVAVSSCETNLKIDPIKVNRHSKKTEAVAQESEAK